MFCTKCGASLPEGANFCESCGAKVETDTVLSESTPVASENVTQLNGEPVTVNTEKSENSLGMGWYKFIINFALWAGAVINIWNAVTAITGLTYKMAGTTPSMVYGIYGPALKATDVFFGVMLLIAAAISVYTRFQLAAFRENGPKFLILLYVYNVTVSVIYLVLASTVTGMNLADASTYSEIATSIVMMIVNIVYFNNRKHLFNN